MNRKIQRATWMALLLASAFLPVAWAEEAPAKPWKNTTDAAVASTNGNSKNTTTSVKNAFLYKWSKTTLEIIGGGLGSSSGDEVTSEQYFANEKMTYNFTEKNYLYERFSWEKNRFAGFRNRWDGSAGLGRNLLNKPKDKLDGELGAGYLNEERIDSPRYDFASGRAYAKYVRLFSETADFSQSVEYIHNFDDTDGYHVNTETALRAALTTKVSLKVSYVWNRAGQPAPGYGKDDTKVLAGLSLTF